MAEYVESKSLCTFKRKVKTNFYINTITDSLIPIQIKSCDSKVSKKNFINTRVLANVHVKVLNQYNTRLESIKHLISFISVTILEKILLFDVAVRKLYQNLLSNLFLFNNNVYK